MGTNLALGALFFPPCAEFVGWLGVAALWPCALLLGRLCGVVEVVCLWLCVAMCVDGFVGLSRMVGTASGGLQDVLFVFSEGCSNLHLNNACALLCDCTVSSL